MFVIFTVFVNKLRDRYMWIYMDICIRVYV